jgi:sugar transferase (PEP-CTERM/EpsH1 system associated)
MNVLMVLLHVPAPTIGVNTRNYHLLRAFAREHSVSLVVLADERNPANQADAAHLASLVRSVRLVSPPPGAKRLRQMQYVAQGQSYRVMAATVPALQAAIDELCGRERFDAVFFEGVLPAGYRLPPGTRVIIDQHNIESELLRRTAEQEPFGPRKLYNWLESHRLEPIELARCAAADAVLVTSERERAALLRRIPGSRIAVVPNGVDLAFFNRSAVSSAIAHEASDGPASDGPASDGPASDGPRIVFTGAMNYFPNVDAAIAFAETCWPRIRERAPEATWQIVGKDPLPAVQRLAALPGVVVTGSVPDVRPYLAGATVAIAPLLVGGGTRLKILEAFAMRVPVVATSLGCEGLSVVPDQHLLVADSPTELVAATVRCLCDAGLRASLAAAGHALAHTEYGWDRIGERLLRAVRTLDGGGDTVPLEAARRPA